MKILSLNTFAATFFETLMAFIKEQQGSTDIFCFQEILTTTQAELTTIPSGKRANLLMELSKLLTGFQVFYAPAQDGIEDNADIIAGVQLGLTIFVRKTLTVSDSGNFFIYKTLNSYAHPDPSTWPYNAAFVGLTVNDKPLTICCLHGVSEPGHKLDTSDRLAQSQTVIDFLNARPGNKIIMGDFNLLPKTESIRMFEKAGYRNLISEFKISTTRGTLHKQFHPEYAGNFQEYADYTFVTPGIIVTSFAVPDVPISDHLPMILEIE